MMPVGSREVPCFLCILSTSNAATKLFKDSKHAPNLPLRPEKMCPPLGSFLCWVLVSSRLLPTPSAVQLRCPEKAQKLEVYAF